mgnify:CR=1 FL=1|tara:strand:- start:51 stop:722 length:672 start_codon:yes stop_codon:yes gene_type:complete
MNEKRFLKSEDIKYLRKLLAALIEEEFKKIKETNKNASRGTIVGNWKSKLNIKHTNTINHWLNGTSIPSNKVLDDIREELWKNCAVELGSHLDESRFRKLFANTKKEEKIKYNIDLSTKKSIVDDENFAKSLSQNISVLENILSGWNREVPLTASTWLEQIAKLKPEVEKFFLSLKAAELYLYGRTIPNVFIPDLEDNYFYFLISDQKGEFKNSGIDLQNFNH